MIWLSQELADAIFLELDTQGATQADLAYLTGFSQKHISQMLTKGIGTTEAWQQLAFALGCTWTVTLSEKD